MKIYTKTGDVGTTALLGGRRVSKAHIRIEAYGTVDELNSYIGLLRDQKINDHRSAMLKQIQDNLFIIGTRLATEPGNNKLTSPELHEDDILMLEKAMDSMEEMLPELKNFVLPGGHQSVSFAHLARCVCRRAERMVIALNEQELVDQLIMKYLNRLSDFLFMLGRKMTQELGTEEVKWESS